MDVTIIGSGTGIPVKGRSPAGLLLEVAYEKLLFDSGAGTLQRLAERGVSFLELDRLYYTHFHVDHSLDLISMVFALRIPELRRTKPLTVYGPKGLRRFWKQARRLYPKMLEPKQYQLSFVELSLKPDGTAPSAAMGYAVKTQPMRHSLPALGYRVEADKKIFAYAGDTDDCPGLIELGRGADLLVLECSMPDERKVAGHLTPTECGRIALETGCKQLLLTHFYPFFEGYDILARVRIHYRGPATLAEDGMRFTLAP